MNEGLKRSVTAYQILRELDAMTPRDRDLATLELVRKTVRNNPPFMKEIIDALLSGMYQKIDELRDHAQIAELAAESAVSMLKENRITPAMRENADYQFNRLVELGKKKRTYCVWTEEDER